MASERRPSLVDGAEMALRGWLSPDRHRPGDRLPPEHDLAVMLGVSRGTLRSALQRLEDTGEVLRRQGSGTFVGRVEHTASLEEGLERLESYSSLARRRGMRLAVRRLEVVVAGVDQRGADALGVPAGTPVTRIARVVLAACQPTAYMVDVVHPEVDLPPGPELEAALRRGGMVLDVLVAAGVPVAAARTGVLPRLVVPGSQEGDALGLAEPIAALELEETMLTAAGRVVQHSVDLFAPGGVALHVVRRMGATRPVAVRTP